MISGNKASFFLVALANADGEGREGVSARKGCVMVRIRGSIFLTLGGLSDKLHLRGNLKGKRVKQFGL